MIKLTESELSDIIMKTAKHMLREYNGSDAIEDFENGTGSLENGFEGSDSPAGFDSNSEEGLHREGSLEDICNGHFQNIDELKSFMTKLGEAIGMEDEMENVVGRIDDTEGYEGEMTGW